MKKDSLLHNCRVELKDASLKATPARLAVLKLLEKANKPVDVTSIIDYLKQNDTKADPATIFRIINIFTDKGITQQIQFYEGKARYELSSKNDHHHLICARCGTIEDVSDCPIYRLRAKIKKKNKFLVKRHSLEFFGICKQCQR